MSIKITGANHFAISVADLDETVEWYTKVFGFPTTEIKKIPERGFGRAELQAPGFAIEIFCMEGSTPLPEYRREPDSDRRVQGNMHMSFGVPNARILLEEFEKLGVDVVSSGEAFGIFSIFIRDNTGNLIEILEEGE